MIDYMSEYLKHTVHLVHTYNSRLWLAMLSMLGGDQNITERAVIQCENTLLVMSERAGFQHCRL